jgi:magnesium-transporting ATPase (P-type)
MENMQPLNQQELQQKIELRMRTLRTLWIALLMSIGIYYVFTLFLHRSEDLRSNPALSLILAVIAVSAILSSFIIKSRILNRATEQQQVSLVQQAYILAWAVTEVAAMMGLIDFLTTNDRYYYGFFLIAACGQLIHFPQREHVTNALFKSSTF